MLLATAQVQQREVEQACHTGLKAVELLGTLRSNRGAEYLEDFQQRLEPFRDEPVVREFGARHGAAGGGVRTDAHRWVIRGKRPVSARGPQEG